MTTPPTRCCAPATSGRCANPPQPGVQTRYIGPVEIAACNLPKHQDALKALPAFERREGYCGAKDCCKVAPSGLCIEHHNLYRRHGVLPRLLLATEPAPMPTPAAPADLPAVQSPPTPAPPRGILDRATGPGTDGASDGEEVEPDPLPPIWQPGVLALHPLETRRDALVARLLAPESDVTLVCAADHPTPESLLSALFGPPKVEPTAPAPTLAEVQEQIRTLQAQLAAERVGNAKYVCDAALSGLRIVAESAPLARVAELEEERHYERKRADGALSQLHDAQRELKAIAALLDADPERSPAWDDNDQLIPLPRRVDIALMPGESQIVADLRASFRGIEQQLGDVDAALHALGAYGLGSTKERLLQVLPVDDRRALLELDAAELRASLARLRARRLIPPLAERVAEYQRKLDIVDAKLSSLDYDHSPDAGKMVG